MPRYFLEVAYKGTRYSGFQIQDNANTVQAEIEKAFHILQRETVVLTGSSRTDSGVHACQNYFHFDYDHGINPQFVYKMNALLSKDISVKSVYEMHSGAHCRFDAISREYTYRLHNFKNPFLDDVSFFLPYHLDRELLEKAAGIVEKETNFFAFAKTNSQVKNFTCIIKKSHWIFKDEEFIYEIEANRFLRGMVRLLTGSIIKVGRGKVSIPEFQNLFKGEQKCGHSVPAQGLFLKKVNYPENFLSAPRLRFTGLK